MCSTLGLDSSMQLDPVRVCKNISFVFRFWRSQSLSRVTHFCSYPISSVINYWTDSRPHGICLLDPKTSSCSVDFALEILPVTKLYERTRTWLLRGLYCAAKTLRFVILRLLQNFPRAHWLIFMVNIRTDTWIWNSCDAPANESGKFVSLLS